MESTHTSVSEAVAAARANQVEESGSGVASDAEASVYVQWVLTDELEPGDGPVTLDTLEVGVMVDDEARIATLTELGWIKGELYDPNQVWEPEVLADLRWPDDEAFQVWLVDLLAQLDVHDGATLNVYP